VKNSLECLAAYRLSKKKTSTTKTASTTRVQQEQQHGNSEERRENTKKRTPGYFDSSYRVSDSTHGIEDNNDQDEKVE